MSKNMILIFLGVLFIGTSVYFLKVNSDLKQGLKKSEIEFKKQLSTGQDMVRKDLEEKYRADMVSYQAMAKRLELEKKKAKEMQFDIEKLESRLKGHKGKSPKKARKSILIGK